MHLQQVDGGESEQLQTVLHTAADPSRPEVEHPLRLQLVATHLVGQVECLPRDVPHCLGTNKVSLGQVRSTQQNTYEMNPKDKEIPIGISH